MIIFNIEERGVHRVALFKIFKGNAAKLPTAKTEGYMYITQDRGDIYVDISSTERKQLNANYANKLRDSTDTSKMLNKGDLGQAVYFSGGVPTLCREHVDMETDQTIGGTKYFTANHIGFINGGETDKFFDFAYGNNPTASNAPGASWRIGALNSGSGNTNYFVIQTGGSDTTATTWKNAMRIGMNDLDVTFGGVVTATSFAGNASSATKLATARNINGTAFDGSKAITTANWGTARTISISSTAGTTGTSINGSANASLVIPSTLTGFTSITSTNFVGNASTATKLANARTISLTGDVTGSGSFDGSGNLSITTVVGDNSHSHSYLPLSGGTLTGVVNSSSTLNLYGSNAYFSLATGASSTRCYFQTYNSVTAGADDANLKAGFGFGWANSLTIDKSGNVNIVGTATATKVYGAVWNDYAEYRAQKETVEPGYCVTSSDNGEVYKTTEKFAVCDGIVSDTFGFSIGETDSAKTPLAVAGRVLAYCAGNREDYHAGDVVCAGPEGRVMKMTREEIREYPDRIIGHVSEIPSYDTWGTGNIAVNGRIWIKVR